MERRRYLAVGALLAVTAYVAGDVLDVVPGVLTRTPSAATSPSELPSPSLAPSLSGPLPTAVSSTTVAQPQVAEPTMMPLAALSSTAPLPSEAGMRAALGAALADPALGPSVGIEVRDALTSSVLLSIDGNTPRAPASLTKILSATAIASSADLAERLPTRVVQGSSAQQIVLVAGGDTLLAAGDGNQSAVLGRAGMADLASQVATQLESRQITRVNLAIDATFAAGPTVSAGWPRGDLKAGFVGPVTMMRLVSNRPGATAAADKDPIASAGTAFVAALRARGIAVTGRVTREPARAGAPQLGLVESATLGEQLEWALRESDNTLTETLARRQAVRDGADPSFAGVAGWITRRIGALGVSTEGMSINDASGLTPGNRVPAATIAAVLAIIASTDQPVARVRATLPIAGLTGTLTDRFTAPAARAGAGVVRAKTGTLTGVSALAGTVVDAEGRLLVFSALADRVPTAGTEAARAALDRVSAVLAGCGCR